MTKPLLMEIMVCAACGRQIENPLSKHVCVNPWKDGRLPYVRFAPPAEHLWEDE